MSELYYRHNFSVVKQCRNLFTVFFFTYFRKDAECVVLVFMEAAKF